MKRSLALAVIAVLAACAQSASPTDPAALLAAHAATVRDLPVAPPGAALPDVAATLTRIAFASCQTAEKPIPLLDRMVADAPQLAVFMGDNVYGDANAGDITLPELRAQYARLAARPEFARLRAAVPMLAAWDDHDYGLNDAGGDFSGRFMAKRIFETFWRVPAAHRDGVYDAHTFGPPGRRVQIVLLDTRFARSALTRPAEPPPNGRYVPSEAAMQQMLSPAQWTWFEAQLKAPADIRLVVSSIQVLADGHGWEAWRLLPREQARLYDTVRRIGAKGVVFISGDRHIAGLYKQNGLLGYPAYELTTSSLNLSFRDTSTERSSNQIGDMYAPVNYGAIDIDWTARRLALQVRGADGAVVREQAVAFAEIGAM